MIRRKLLMAIAILASLTIIACSEMTGPKNAPAGLPGATKLAQQSGPATVVATINGGGTANMDDGAGKSSFGIGVKLLDDFSATGHFDCVDHHGDRPGYPGNIFGEVTSWRREGTDIVLNITGKFLPIPGGHPQDVSFTVKIQRFGGAGVGHWTLEIGGTIFCFETLTSGQIVYRPA